MTTDLTDKQCPKIRRFLVSCGEAHYTETFDGFCESMLLTDFLKDEEKFIIRKLLRQWRMNKK